MRCELAELHSVLGEVRELQETLLELPCLLAVLIELADLLLAYDLCFESPFDDVAPDILHAIDEQVLKITPLNNIVDILRLLFPQLVPHSFYSDLQVLDGLGVVCLESLSVVEDLKLHVVLVHVRVEDEIDKLLELDILRWNVPVTALGQTGSTLRLCSLVCFHRALEALALSSSFHCRVIHKVLLNERLRVLYVVDRLIVELLLDIGTSKESVVLMGLLRFGLASGRTEHLRLWWRRDGLSMHSANRHFQQLVFPLGVEGLLMEELLLINFGLVLLLPHFEIFLSLKELVLAIDLILSQLVIGLLKVVDTLLLDILILILLCKCLDKLLELAFLLLDIDVVSLQVFVLLAPEHRAQLLVERLQLSVEVGFQLNDSAKEKMWSDGQVNVF